MTRLLALAVAAPMFVACDSLLMDGPTATSAMGSLCPATQEPLTGVMSEDLAGTWQDWAGMSQQVIRMSHDGQLSLWDSHYDEAGTGYRQTVTARGAWTVHQGTLSITWDDGATEVSRASIEDAPGCEMLVFEASNGTTSRLSKAGELERVSCPDPEPARPAIAAQP